MARQRIDGGFGFVMVGVCLLASTPLAARADVVPNGVFGTGMVLQRDMPVPVWGTAAPGEKVTVEFAGQTVEATADATGTWRADLAPLAASSTPATLVIRGTNLVALDDVVVGDVWLCSGQSNMAYPMMALHNKPDYAGDITSADLPLIRQGLVPREPSLDPAASRSVKWTACSPATVGAFTAAGFYFAREIHADQKVPVGLLLSAWGGTSAESWISREALDTVPRFKTRADEQAANLQSLPARIASFPAELAAWEAANGRTDPGNRGEAEGWMNAGSAAGWSPGKSQQKWADLGLPDGGVAWVRKIIAVDPAKAGKGFRLDLGQVNEQYVTAYWNGRKLGDFGRKPPAFYKSYTHFDVPAADVRAGENVLALRFVTHLGDRPPLGRALRDMGLKALGVADDSFEVRVETPFPPLAAAARSARPKTPEGDAAHTSAALYGGMIRPLAPFAIKGAIWYQGEGDGSRGYDYRSLLPLLIESWRKAWGREVPFVVQQLPNWKASGARDTGWAEVREAQWMTSRSLPAVGIAIATEIGESDDAHPANKRDIGKRLALVAFEKFYGRDVPGSGPVIAAAVRDGDGFRVTFKATGALKTTDGKPPRLFLVAGNDKAFVDADATIDGDAVIVKSAGVAAPEAVRYAWINDTAGANLTDDTGLPTAPFRSDTWKIRGEP
jgi:sialate O-acetylesterase